MIPWEKRVLLKHYLDEGIPISSLAARLGIGRRTIHRWIRDGQLDRDVDAGQVRYRRRPPQSHKLDPFKPILLTRLAAYPELTATRLYAEIKAAGYDGAYDAVKVFARESRPKPAEDPVVRFETAPGLQAQVDFAEFRLPWGKRYALLVVWATLGCSGSGSTSGRTCAPCSPAWRKPSSSSAACLASCSSTR